MPIREDVYKRQVLYSDGNFPDHLDIYGTKEAYLESFRHYTELILSLIHIYDLYHGK